MTPRRYRLYQVDAFTTQRFQGNPAGVVTNADGLSVEQMQTIARELNNSETAFVLPPDAADHEVRVRFFTPTTEVPSCGHATIAAHYVRAIEDSLPSAVVVQKIGAGILPVAIVKQDDDYKIVMTQGAIEFGEPFDSELAAETLRALSLSPDALDGRSPIEIVSTRRELQYMRQGLKRVGRAGMGMLAALNRWRSSGRQSTAPFPGSRTGCRRPRGSTRG